MALQETLTLVAQRASDPSTRRDESALDSPMPCPPATNDDIAEAEVRLGFSLPAALRLLYMTVGNGGFGPGYGILGIGRGFTDDQDHTADALYSVFAECDPTDEAWKWPEKLLPICHWGCAIYSCVDCSDPNIPVLIWDPNNHEPGTSPANAIRPNGRQLDSWLRAWADGVDLWNEMSPDIE